MHGADTSWPPHIGDDVYVTATGATGEVTAIVGAGADHRFTISIWAPPDAPPSAAQVVRHRLCTLDDISPVRQS